LFKERLTQHGSIKEVNILNCESAVSIYQSIETTFGVDSDRLNAVFDSVAKNHWHFDSAPDDDLTSALQQIAGTQHPFEATYWFHLTRAKRDNRFEAGLLPLGRVIDSVWAMLFELLDEFPEDLWREFRAGVEGTFPDDEPGVEDYRRKVHNEFHWGPYAYLIKEHVLRDYRSSRILTRYLEQPEVVENICLNFKERHAVDLLALFRANTAPCIVRFSVDGSESKHLGAALRYIYYLWHGASDLPFNPIRIGIAMPTQINGIHFIETASD
jgi:hypothetical protein